MTISNKIKEPNYFHREYGNDIDKPKYDQTWLDQTKRIAITALPFAQAALNSWKPASFTLALGFGGMRVYTTTSQLIEAVREGSAEEQAYCLFQTTVAVVALAGTIFAHPVGMLITTGHDLVIDLFQLIEHLKEGNKEKAIESCLSIINNTLYFTLFLHGGIEMTILSLAMQILLGLYRSQSEFRNDHWIEAIGHLGMSLMRGRQLSSQVHTYQIVRHIKALSANAKVHAATRIESPVNKLESNSTNSTVASSETANRWPSPGKPHWEEIPKLIKEMNLPLEGQLKLHPNGWYYLDIDNRYITELYGALRLSGQHFTLPSFFEREEAAFNHQVPGAHFKVFHAHEHVAPKELGKTFHFEPKVVEWDNHTYGIALLVESIELERLREHYGLSPRLNGKEFFISLARNKWGFEPDRDFYKK